MNAWILIIGCSHFQINLLLVFDTFPKEEQKRVLTREVLSLPSLPTRENIKYNFEEKKNHLKMKRKAIRTQIS